MLTRRILQLDVSDRPGVLDRIVGLVRRWGWNIESLTVGSIGGGRTQITMLMEGRGIDTERLMEYLEEMDAVHDFRELTDDGSLLRELALFRVPPDDAALSAEGVRVLRREGGMVSCEYTASPQAVDAFVAALRGRGIACVRSGPLAYLDEQEG